MNIVGVIQARLGSTRLPYKMLLSLHGHPIIEWVVKRVQMSRSLNEIVAAIPETRENDILEKYIDKLDVDVQRGNEEDVLGRLYGAAKLKKATHVVRICGDNPLIAAEEIDRLIEFYFNNPCDYAYNHIPEGNTYPDGFGAEIVSFEWLEYLNRTVTNRHYREHCFLYITENPSLFNIKTFNPPDHLIAFPDMKFDVDNFEDYYKLSLKDFSFQPPPESL